MLHCHGLGLYMTHMGANRLACRRLNLAVVSTLDLTSSCVRYQFS